jgi:hypothetical protein
VNVSTNVVMQSKALTGAMPVIRFILMVSHGRVDLGLGDREPRGFEAGALIR